jgi:hypothetical protein
VSAARAYLDALAAHDPGSLDVAGDLRVTENGQALALGDGIWGTATAVAGHDVVLVRDGEHEAWIGVVEEHGRPSVVFLRTRTRDGRLAEVETIVRRPHERLYDPSTLGAPRAELLGDVPEGERSSREELAAAGHAYFDGLEQADGSIIPVVDGCTRFENGTKTVRVEDVSHLAGSASASVFPLGVREQVDTGYFSYIAAVRGRRVVACDEARGLVVMVVAFDHPARSRTVTMRGVGEVELPAYHQVPNSVLIGELFRVRAGVIEHIEAVLEFAPYGMPTGWEAAG